LAHRALATIDAMVSIRDQALIGYQAILFGRRLVGPQTDAAIAFQIIGPSGDEGDALMPVGDEVLDGLAHAAGVVDCDGGAASAIGNKHYWVPGRSDLFYVRCSCF
jgi:hypothetical protein